MEIVQVNSIKAWLLAARPKTLAGAATPVLLGCALAYADSCFQMTPALLCFAFAFLMQIDANFINDYFDYLKGSDREDRLGPERACAQGWITLNAMRKGIALTTATACLAGLCLLAYGGIETVSYTHLDVYKRQVSGCSKVRSVIRAKSNRSKEDFTRSGYEKAY